jgi:DNA-binding MarR family transcriptional regulator
MMKEIARTERLWNRLMTGWKQRRPAIERHLKKAGFPSLLHYEALSYLSQAPAGEMELRLLEKNLRIPQFKASRLLQGMSAERLVQRRTPATDKRLLLVEITPLGRALQRRMLLSISSAIEPHLSGIISHDELVNLMDTLDRLDGDAPKLSHIAERMFGRDRGKSEQDRALDARHLISSPQDRGMAESIQNRQLRRVKNGFCES